MRTTEYFKGDRVFGLYQTVLRYRTVPTKVPRCVIILHRTLASCRTTRGQELRMDALICDYH